MSTSQFIYALTDPMWPHIIRYVGRTNDLELRLRMHLAEAPVSFSIKDVWITYLQYAGRQAMMTCLETCEASALTESEIVAKGRERHWIKHYSSSDSLLNSVAWNGHPIRRNVPSGVKQAWCGAHVLLWELDRHWKDELHLLKYLADRCGSIVQTTPSANGQIVETLGEISLATSIYERRRYRCWSVLKSILDAHPNLAVGDLDAISKPF